MRLFAILALVICWGVWAAGQKGDVLEDPPAVKQPKQVPALSGPTRVYHPVLRTVR